MTSKPLGGRGKKESYNSYVVRLPDSLKPQVDKLLDNFHASRTKPVKGSVYQLPASMVCDLMKTAIPIDVNDFCLSVICHYPRYEDGECNWGDEWDVLWTEKELPKLERLHQLADKVNRCIWQIDNSFAFNWSDDVRKASELLVEYGLVEMDNSTPAASAKTLFDWVTAKQGCRTCFGEALWDAFEDERFDLLTALEVGKKHPVNRTEYWHTKYTEQLAQPNINYWGWLGNPESKEICHELSNLLQLPEPERDAATILECLAEGKDPFFKPETNGTYLSFEKFLSQGKLANYNPEQKKAYRRAFTEWHLAALDQVGQEILTRIYKVVYKSDWDLIETIVSTMSGEWWEVLGVSPQASGKEVKAAHRRLAKMWHPDINSSSKAQEYMTRINRAFEQYENKTCYK